MTTILVVDDDQQTRDFLSDTLQYAGYSAITAANGLAGMQLAEEHLPDLIISDIHMPQLDGYQMLRRIRRAPQTSAVPVIFLTGENDERAMRKGMLGGAEDFLLKPVQPGDLLSAVKVQLDKRSALDERHHSTLRLLRKNIIYALPHELRTPLQLISGYASLLEMDEGRADPNDVLEYARAISTASSRLSRLFENYLIYAQVELLHADAEALASARNHLVKDAAAVIEDSAKGRAAAFKRPDDLQLKLAHLALRISEKDLSKIIFELVDNAFRFSPPGTPVTVRSFQEEDLLFIAITDAGHGMTHEQVQMMGAYMQFGRELYEQQGVGLGFTVAKRLIELHGGAVKVESQPEQGTVVFIRFPLY
jgi:two-component system sensor histidine kinase/response regulator